MGPCISSNSGITSHAIAHPDISDITDTLVHKEAGVQFKGNKGSMNSGKVSDISVQSLLNSEQTLSEHTLTISSTSVSLDTQQFSLDAVSFSVSGYQHKDSATNSILPTTSTTSQSTFSSQVRNATSHVFVVSDINLPIVTAYKCPFCASKMKQAYQYKAMMILRKWR